MSSIGFGFGIENLVLVLVLTLDPLEVLVLVLTSGLSEVLVLVWPNRYCLCLVQSVLLSNFNHLLTVPNSAETRPRIAKKMTETLFILSQGTSLDTGSESSDDNIRPHLILHLASYIMFKAILGPFIPFMIL